LWWADAQGIRLEQLTRGDEHEQGPVWSSEPSHSPDGLSIVFTRASYAEDRQGFRSEIAVLSLADRSVTILPRPPQLGADALPGQPAWGPDGHRIAISLQHGLAILDLSTHQARLLATEHGTDLTPDWSPDGRLLAFQSQHDGIMDIWTVDTQSGKAEKYFSQPFVDGFPSWSPDGRFLAITSSISGNYDIWVVPRSGGYPRRLTTSPFKDMQPDWSPDGRFIVFVSERGGSSDLWVIPVQGGEPTRVTWDPGEEVHPNWSPDGRSIVFTSNASGGVELWRVTDLPPAAFLERDFESAARRLR